MDYRITYVKAVGIILMVLCHSMFWDCPFVYMFHMPLFFICSGFCFKDKYLSKPHVFLWQRIKGVYFPYVKWSLIFLFLHNVFFSVNIYSNLYGYDGAVSNLYTTDEIWNRFNRILVQMSGHEQLLGGYWFLKSLFWGSIISISTIFMAKLVSKFLGGYLMLLISGFVCLIAICLILNSYHRTISIFYVSAIDVLASCFVISGYLIKFLNIPRFKPVYMVLSLGLLFLGCLLWPMKMTDFNGDSYSIIPYIFTALLGTWALYSLQWSKIQSPLSKILLFIGDNTLTILTWHFLSFKLISLLIVSIYNIPDQRLAEFPVIVEFSQQGWWVAYFLVSMAVCCLIAYCNRFIKYSWLKL